MDMAAAGRRRLAVRGLLRGRPTDWQADVTGSQEQSRSSTVHGSGREAGRPSIGLCRQTHGHETRINEKVEGEYGARACDRDDGKYGQLGEDDGKHGQRTGYDGKYGHLTGDYGKYVQLTEDGVKHGQLKEGDGKHRRLTADEGKHEQRT